MSRVPIRRDRSDAAALFECRSAVWKSDMRGSLDGGFTSRNLPGQQYQYVRLEQRDAVQSGTGGRARLARALRDAGVGIPTLSAYKPVFQAVAEGHPLSLSIRIRSRASERPASREAPVSARAATCHRLAATAHKTASVARATSASNGRSGLPTSPDAESAKTPKRMQPADVSLSCGDGMWPDYSRLEALRCSHPHKHPHPTNRYKRTTAPCHRVSTTSRKRGDRSAPSNTPAQPRAVE